MKPFGSVLSSARRHALYVVMTLCCLVFANRMEGQLVGSGGLTGKYYNGTSFNTLVLTRVDPMVDFKWRSGSPGSGVNAGNFSVRWTGMIQARYSEVYQFSTSIASNGTCNVWINGVQAGDYPTNFFALKAGQFYAIKVEYTHFTASWVEVALNWESASQRYEPVPAQYLLPTELATSHTPIAYAAQPLDNGFTAAWALVSGATGYRLDVSTDPQFGSFVSGYSNLDVGNVLTKTVTGLADGKYYYRVRANWSGGTTVNSNTIAAAAYGQTLLSTFTTSYSTNIGVTQTYTVPAGANRLTIKAWGGGGAGSNGAHYGGGGGFVTATYAVTANQTVNVVAGSAGGDKGAGASAVWRVGGFQLIAGGGGSATETQGGGAGGEIGGRNFVRSNGTPMNLSGGASYTHNGSLSGAGGGYYAGNGTQGGTNYVDTGNGYVADTGRDIPGWDDQAGWTQDPDYGGFWFGYAGTPESPPANPGYVVIKAYSVEILPEITVQPMAVMVANAGNSATLSVVALGHPALSYQWKKNGANISGATSSTLTISSVQTSDVAAYTVEVSNSVGSVTSTAAALSIDTPPGAPPWIGYLEKTDKTITITWGASADNVGVSHYIVERGSSPAQIGTTTELVFTDVGLTANTAYLYQVKAVDTAGKTSAASSQLSVTTNASATADADGDGVPDSVETALGTVSSATNANATQVPNNIHRPRL